MNKIKKGFFRKFIILFFPFLHGVMLTFIFILAENAIYEDRLYDQIVQRVVTPSMSEQQRAIKLMDLTYTLLKPRSELFSNLKMVSIRSKIFRSADTELIDAKGNCGGYMRVLGKFLRRAGIKIRPIQLKRIKFADHVALEANIDGRWIFFDPSYDLTFKNEDGKLATIKDLNQNWEYYKPQVPEAYPIQNFKEYRYANWNRIPVIMPVAKTVLQFFIGDRINTFSFRVFMLNTYRSYLILSLVVYFILVVFTVSFYKRFSKE